MLQLFYDATETVAPIAEHATAGTPNVLLTVLASAFGGAILTGAITIWSKRMDNKAAEQKRQADLEAERERWIRQEKLAVYTKYVTMARSCVNDAALNSTRERARITRSEMVPIASHLRLLAGNKIANKAVFVNAKLKPLVKAGSRPDSITEAQEVVKTRFSELIALMQKDLGIEIQNQVDQ